MPIGYFGNTTASAAAAVSTAGLSRVLAKLVTTQNIAITVLSDSILEGATVTSDGGSTDAATRTYTSATTSVGDDCMAQLAFNLATNYAVSVTKTNRSHSGYTAADQMNLARDSPSRLALAITDAADLYIISHGHNDIGSDINSPGTGLPKAASWQATEHMIRRLRREVPAADIIIATETPYNTASTSTNVYLKAYNVGLARLAAEYGCRLIDIYSAIVATGSVDTYILPIGDPYANHPGKVGHAFMYARFIEAFPLTAPIGTESPPVIPDTALYNADRYTYGSWSSTTTGPSRTLSTSGYRLAGTWSGTNAPNTSSTANDVIECQFVGDACLLRLTCGSGQGTVKITTDGVTSYASLDLSTVASGGANTYFVPLTNLGWGMHVIRITILSGSVTWGGLLWAPSASDYMLPSSSRVAYTGTWSNASGNSAYWSGVVYSTTTQNDYFTVDFVGTGLALNIYRYSSTGGPNITTTIDGGTESANINLAVAAVGPTNYPTGYVVTSGLDYGRHTCKVKLNEAGRSIDFGGAFTIDERHYQRLTRQSGVAYVGEAIVYPVAYANRPLLTITQNDGIWAGLDPPPYATSPTATGFTVAGSTGACVTWQAEGSTVLVP